MAKKQIKETIHAKGIDIGIYTTDFENEFISLTDNEAGLNRFSISPTKWIAGVNAIGMEIICQRTRQQVTRK